MSEKKKSIFNIKTFTTSTHWKTDSYPLFYYNNKKTIKDLSLLTLTYIFKCRKHLMDSSVVWTVHKYSVLWCTLGNSNIYIYLYLYIQCITGETAVKQPQTLY